MTSYNNKHLNNQAILKKIKNHLVEKQSIIIDVLAIVVGSMSIMGVFLILSLTLTKNASDSNVIIFSALSLLLGFILFPMYILKKRYSFNLTDIGIKKLKLDFWLSIKFILALLVFVLLSARYDNKDLLRLVILQNISVAIAEEFLYRGVVTYLLEKIFNKGILAHIISGLIFVFILHSGSSFLDNLIYRLPITILLCATYFKFKDLKDTIVIHWLYNVFASSLV